MKWFNGIPIEENTQVLNKELIWKTCFHKKENYSYSMISSDKSDCYTYWDEITYSGRIVMLGKTKKYEVCDNKKVIWVDEKDLSFPEYICEKT